MRVVRSGPAGLGLRRRHGPSERSGARIPNAFHAAAKGGSVMRLSYYGGGHYGSLVNDSDEFDPLADPGSRELLALQKARARKTNADASSALAVSDAEATERAAVEQALSRVASGLRRRGRPGGRPPGVAERPARGRDLRPAERARRGGPAPGRGRRFGKGHRAVVRRGAAAGRADLAAAIDLRTPRRPTPRRGVDITRSSPRRRRARVGDSTRTTHGRLPPEERPRPRKARARRPVDPRTGRSARLPNGRRFARRRAVASGSGAVARALAQHTR